MKKELLVGINSIMTTQFKSNGDLDLPATQKHARFLADSGVDAVVLTGSVGECANMYDEERVEVWSAVKEEIEDDIYIIGGANHTSTRAAMKLAAKAEEVGIDGIMNLTPYYWPSGRGEHLKHLKALSDSTTLPILLYDNPGVTQDQITADFLAEIGEWDNICAIKETCNFNSLDDMIRKAGNKVKILNGEGELQEPYANIAGCPGMCSALSNFLAPTTVKIYEHTLNGDYQKAIEMRRQYVNPITDYIFNPSIMTTWQAVAAYKYIESLMGYSNGVMRLPAYELETKHKEVLDKILEETDHLERNTL